MFGESYVESGAPNAARGGGHYTTTRIESPALRAAGASSSGANGQQQHLRSVKEIIKTLDEEHEISGPKGGCCSRIFVPFLTLAMIIVIFVAIVYTNGTGSDVEASPRVAMIVLEGFSGTVFHALMQSGVHMPNIAHMLSSQKGVWAECATSSQSSCARAVVVENDTSGEVYVSAAAAMTSLFSGVSPREHQVYNGSLESMSMYANTSKMNPSIAKRVKDAGMKVSVVGTSHAINSLSIAFGSCSQPGVLDMECAASREELLRASIDEYSSSVQLDCLASSSCNMDTRKMNSPTDPKQCSSGQAEAQFTRHLNSIFGGLAYSTQTQEAAVQNTAADNLDDSLFVFHFDSLAVRAASTYLPGFQYNVSSKEYVAQVYLLDALVGQVISYVRDRARSQKENWLILGVSDHGGNDKPHAIPNPVSTSENTIAFFMATYTDNLKRFVTLAPLQRPVTQLDVLPTVLTWLNVAPFDAETSAVIAGKNTTAASPAVEARVMERRHFEGLVQGICSSGTSLKDCAV
ncbi:conserved hypothetical protein [Leishmania infantum JPCM5]|uniref:Uncharacterized protein n=3 Tax=Leishmania donovani species complex TaxID=38574 RepID=E9AGE7_LEIIN|nr:conserved hypothetical protein [Leishmania infantum JPCM5]XP_003859172.1 hypothetical protein, conserved [Leishmania donovani]CAC9463249.1 hypothetical_protein_-_conserved [Leishmania infantum]AYU76972.1 hypothetical protein LdCL_120011200 [Leishmania donovani]TPP53922.1 hypothetical protein CGC21_27505 [Leishmania donovani]CBZ08447.1 conserved hypothetical protein [Leishmania infantum JPCM5]CBZ32460.1 hypothetical protein, conserved [Leishmania donovani]|eukprot:XP_003392299.1 conserved hypothetical protein [Leishmania infantum JPCM5]